MKTFKQVLIEAFCEHEYGSAKRLFGGVALLTALGCIIFLTITEGCTSCVEGLLLVLIITSCSLLGLSSITSAFKNGRVSTFEKKKEEENERN